MKAAIFLGTSGLLCYVYRNEPQHEQAIQLMRQYNITDALTTDRHFEQESFHRLLPSPNYSLI